MSVKGAVFVSSNTEFLEQDFNDRLLLSIIHWIWNICWDSPNNQSRIIYTSQCRYQIEWIWCFKSVVENYFFIFSEVVNKAAICTCLRSIRKCLLENCGWVNYKLISKTVWHFCFKNLYLLDIKIMQLWQSAAQLNS